MIFVTNEISQSLFGKNFHFFINISRTKKSLADYYFRPNIFLFGNFCKDFELFSENFLVHPMIFLFVLTFIIAQNVRKLARIFDKFNNAPYHL